MKDLAKKINFLLNEETDSMISLISETEIHVRDDGCYSEDDHTPEAAENIIKLEYELHDGSAADILHIRQGSDLIMITNWGIPALLKAIQMLVDNSDNRPEYENDE